GISSRTTALNGHGMSAIGDLNRGRRMPSRDGRDSDVEASDGAIPKIFDMDFFSSDVPSRNDGLMKKKVTTFGEAESIRGSHEELGKDLICEYGYSSDGRERARRRAAGLKILHK